MPRSKFTIAARLPTLDLRASMTGNACSIKQTHFVVDNKSGKHDQTSALNYAKTCARGPWLKRYLLGAGKLRPSGCPLYPQKRTLVERVGMSAFCQKRTFRTAAEMVIQSTRLRGRVAAAGWSDPGLLPSLD